MAPRGGCQQPGRFPPGYLLSGSDSQQSSCTTRESSFKSNLIQCVCSHIILQLYAAKQHGKGSCAAFVLHQAGFGVWTWRLMPGSTRQVMVTFALIMSCSISRVYINHMIISSICSGPFPHIWMCRSLRIWQTSVHRTQRLPAVQGAIPAAWLCHLLGQLLPRAPCSAAFTCHSSRLVSAAACPCGQPDT